MNLKKKQPGPICEIKRKEAAQMNRLFARFDLEISQPLGSCRMRSPIMFFCTGEVPPAIVMLSL